jgi:RNase adaptor protein for sRNA GlmZ degradation
MTLAHATSVAIDGKGVLLRGASGGGKSDMALRMIAAGAILVADDQTSLSAENGILFASAPPSIAGSIELRGIGIRRLDHLDHVPIILVVDLVGAGAIERLPEPERVVIEGVTLPLLRINPFEASSAAKLILAVRSHAAAGAPDPVGYKRPDMTESVTLPRPIAADAGSVAADIVLVTGMSGAGRSTALKLLEDLGYEAVDNLPLSLLPRLVGSKCRHSVAVGIDTRTRDFGVDAVLDEIEKLIADDGLRCRLLFMDCDDDMLARRYTETRRRHPLAGDRPVMDGIKLERGLVTPLRRRADVSIDTSSLRSGDLKRLLAASFALDAQTGLKLFVTSFSFRDGLPREADLVFDVRFLKNPYYDLALRPLTGLDSAVGNFIATDPCWGSFFESLTGLLRVLLPRYDGEGKSYLTIAIGCTGGRHRSVYTAEQLSAWLRAGGRAVSLLHRDVDRPIAAYAAEPERALSPNGEAS